MLPHGTWWYFLLSSYPLYCWAALSLYKSFQSMFHHPSSIHKYNVPWDDIYTLSNLFIHYVTSYHTISQRCPAADPLSSPVAWLHLLFCGLEKVSRGTSTGFGQFPGSTEHQVLRNGWDKMPGGCLVDWLANRSFIGTNLRYRNITDLSKKSWVTNKFNNLNEYWIITLFCVNHIIIIIVCDSSPL